MDYSAAFQPRNTPQTDLLPGQVHNNAGGGAYELDKWGQLRRFLVLGSEGGTYYQSQADLTRENGKNILACLAADASGPGGGRRRTFDIIREMWAAGRCPRPEPVMFALALAFAEGSDYTRSGIEHHFKELVRTGYHLFRFVHYANKFRGWGRSLKRTVASWYDRPEDQLAYQLVKYQQREGWSHRDVLRLCHAPPTDLLAYAAGKAEPSHPLIYAARAALSESASTDAVCRLIHEHRLTHEMVATKHKQQKSVWAALMAHMPLGALVRNLGQLTARGVIKLGDYGVLESLAARLTDPEAIRKSRIHPMSVLAAARTYAQGRGFRGQLTWDPIPEIIDALDDAFEASFANAEVTGKRYLLGIDVSGSMGARSTLESVSCREAAAAMALITVRNEPKCIPMAFCDQFVPLPISKRTSLQELVGKITGVRFGRTNCARPMRYALEKGLDIDTFVIYTDNETWCGTQHPVEALQQYRRKRVPDAKLAVVALTPTRFSIADPADPGMLDLVGFDSASPQILAEFSKGYA